MSDLNIDRVSLVAVPEPAVYAQLALGLLVLTGARALSRARAARRGGQGRAGAG